MLLFPAIAAMLSALDVNLSKSVLVRTDPKDFLFSYFIIISIALSPFIILFSWKTMSLSLIGLALLAGLLSFIANTLYYRSLETSQVSSLMPLKSLTILTIMVVGGLFYSSERFNAVTYLCIIPILVSIFLLNAGKFSFKKFLGNRKALGAFIIWGFFFIIIKEGLKTATPLTLYWLVGISFLCWQLVFYSGKLSFIRLDKKVNLCNRSISLLLVFISLSVIILSEYLVLYYSIGNLSTTISILIYNSDIFLAAIISKFVHRESFCLRKSVAIMLSFASIILLQTI